MKINNGKQNNDGVISVIMPAYNAEKTILRALDSLFFQTYRRWECIVVDDGSTDGTYRLIETINDKRIKRIRLDKNMGRGFARQVALENCTGEFLAMLDADDWIHPRKLEKQVQAFIDNPTVDLVSSGIGVIDKYGELFGVRAKGDGSIHLFQVPGKVPVAHAPSMLRMNCAKLFTYDTTFLLAQDVDFLRRFLFKKNYLILDRAYYYYTEHESSSLKKVTSGYFYNIKGLVKFIPSFPFVISANIIDQILKAIVFNILGLFGQFETMLKRRTVVPSPKDVSDFTESKKAFESLVVK